MQQPTSQPLPDSVPLQSRTREYECPSCGARYLAKSSACPFCKSHGATKGEEITKKIVDDSDLYK
jgi:predicted RNA-binding Zn-ribbon protein involved in translation (DUF1610 family)